MSWWWTGKPGILPSMGLQRAGHDWETELNWMNDQDNHSGVPCSPRARHPGMWSQVGLRKHCYKQSQWRWWNFSWAVSNSKRWCCGLKVWHSVVRKFGKLSCGHRNGKDQFSFQSQRRAMPRSVQTTTQACLFPMLVMLCLKSSELGFNSMWTKNFQMYNLGLEKAEEPEIKLPTFTGSKRKQRNSRKNIYFCLTDDSKVFDCVDHNKLW